MHYITARPCAASRQLITTLTFIRTIVYNNPTMSKFLSQRLTRRQALEVLGISAAAAAIPRGAFAQEPTFPKGAIIRTLLKDYAPEELAGGATLFHEHMQLAPDFNAKFAAATAAARAANGLPPAPARGGGGRGALRQARTSCTTSI